MQVVLYNETHKTVVVQEVVLGDQMNAYVFGIFVARGKKHSRFVNLLILNVLLIDVHSLCGYWC